MHGSTLVRRISTAALALLLATASFACTDDASPLAGEPAEPPAETPADDPGKAAEPNSADRWLVWARCEQVLRLNDRELDEWQARGAGGFVCQAGDLAGIGGARDFRATASPPTGDTFRLEHLIVRSGFVERAAARDMDVYLGFYAVNRGENQLTPFADWFDDERWSDNVLPAIGRLAVAAKVHGFAGVALDQELYISNDGTRATWDWDHRGNGRTEPEVREQVRTRGRQVMEALVDAYSGVEVLAYHTMFPGTWDAVVQEEVNDIEEPYRDSVQIDFWDGMSGIDGYRTISLLNALFYKEHHIGPGWDTALQYHYNALFATLSQRFRSWPVAYDRFQESPFAWISEGETNFERARSPEAVEEQLLAMARWGMGGTSALYAFGDTLLSFDYTPYEHAMQAAAEPRVVDSTPPTLRVEPVDDVGATIDLRGTATDDLAVRSVRWSDGQGNGGVAEMAFEVTSGDVHRGFEWRMSWAAEDIPVPAGGTTLTVTVEDIKGLTTTQEVRVAP